jgi:hypothetical protein
VNARNSRTILFEAVTALNEYHDSKEQLEIIEFLLDNGADVNIKTADGCNALHVALEYHNLSNVSLLLITKGNAGINETDAHGNNPVFIAIREYGKTWREEVLLKTVDAVPVNKFEEIVFKFVINQF